MCYTLIVYKALQVNKYNKKLKKSGFQAFTKTTDKF